MMVVPHTCVNAIAGRFFKRPGSAFVAGVVAHGLLDLLPHKDVSAHKAEGLAAGLMLGIVGTSCGFNSPAFWCSLGGLLPDVEQVLPWTDPKRGRRRWFPTHNGVHHSLPLPGRSDWRLSLLAQGTFSLAALLAVVASCRNAGKS